MSKIIKVNLKILYNLNRKEKSIIAFMILIIAGYFIYNLIIPPVLFRYKTIKRQLNIQKHLIRSKEDKTRILLSLENNFESLHKKMDEQNEMFFTSEEVDSFLNGLERMCTNENIDFKKIQPKATEIISDSHLKSENMLVYKRETVDINIQGKYNDVLNFFYSLAHYKKLLDVSQLDLRHSKENLLSLDAKFVLNIYILGE